MHELCPSYVTHPLVAVSLALACGCAVAGDPANPDAPVPPIDGEVRGGRFHARTVSATSVDALLVAAAADLPALTGFEATHFSEPEWRRDQTRAGRELTHASLRQHIAGIPIRGGYVRFTLRTDGEHALAASSFHLFGGDVDPVPAIAQGEAEAIALASARHPGSGTDRARLVIEPRRGRLQLVWDVAFPEHHERVVVDANGPRAGRARVIDDRVYEAEGRVRGLVATEGAPAAGATTELLGLRGLEVRWDELSAHTDGDGRFVLDGDATGPVQAWLSGEAAVVSDSGGSEIEVSAPASGAVELTFEGDAGEHAVAQVTAYHHVDATRRFLVDNGAAPEVLGAPLATNVNIPSACNAYYSPSARTINFYRSSATCYNTAEASIVAHEYGHFADDVYGGITNGGLSEGWGDLLACLLLDDPTVGRQFFKDGDPTLRSCDNDYRFPASGFDEVHALGQAWAGFGWHLREELIALYGDEEGDARARELLVPSLFSNAPDIPAAVREVVVRDDDDGDVANGTPHWDAIKAAADRHALTFVLEDDVSPPGAIDDFEAEATGATKIELRWTAPGDDAGDGTVADYELRWSYEPIDPGNFSAAEPLPAPAPLPAGSSHQLEVEVPPGGDVYLAVRAVDDAGNQSPVAVTGPLSRPQPQVFYTAGAEDGLGDWEATGLWHVTHSGSSAGAASYWYGQETTGDYDTGGRTSGTLLSPVIDLGNTSGVHLLYDEWVAVEASQFYDRMTVEVRDADTDQVVVVAEKETGATDGFRPRLVDLTAMDGRRIRLAFRFDSVDGVSNDTLGWMIDEVRLVTGDAAPPALLVNEVLADPPAGFDANGDGVWSYRDDELLELVNTGGTPLDLGRATIADGVRVRATIADGVVLAPGTALVVFGGGEPAELPGAVVQVASGGLYLNNDGDVIRIRAADGELLAELSYGGEGGDDVSLVRQTDAEPNAPMVRHDSVSDQPASPGTRSDGTPF